MTTLAQKITTANDFLPQIFNGIFSGALSALPYVATMLGIAAIICVIIIILRKKK